jgi:hypothetical protein
MKKDTSLAWIRTVRLLIMHRCDLEKVKKETDRELTDQISGTFLKTA